MNEMNANTIRILTPLSEVEISQLEALKSSNDEKTLFTSIDKLRQIHQLARHDLADEMLDLYDPRSEFFQAQAEYNEKLKDPEFPIEKLNQMEIHLKALHNISQVRSLA